MIDYHKFLSDWNVELLSQIKNLPSRESSEIEIIKRGSILNVGATDEEIQSLEERLGKSLPPSYKNFLKVSNGWIHFGALNTLEMLSAAEVDWLRNDAESNLIEVWTDLENMSARDDQFVDPAHLKEALVISEWRDGDFYLLNPMVIDENGEWQAWFFGDKNPGAFSYQSFLQLMENDRRESIRELAKESDQHHDLRNSIDEFVSSLKDSDENVRRDAALKLSQIVTEEDVFLIPHLLTLLSDKDQVVRSSAMHSLGVIGDESTVEPLINGLKDQYRHIRNATAMALENIGDKKALEPLKQALEREQQGIADDAAFDTITDRSANDFQNISHELHPSLMQDIGEDLANLSHLSREDAARQVSEDLEMLNLLLGDTEESRSLKQNLSESIEKALINDQQILKNENQRQELSEQIVGSYQEILEQTQQEMQRRQQSSLQNRRERGREAAIEILSQAIEKLQTGSSQQIKI